MPKVSKETASQVQEFGPVIDRREEMSGYSVEFVSFGADADLDGPLQSLPGGACQCPHWGYVIAGRMRAVLGDQEEVYQAGDAFYLPPGHRPYVDAGTELLQFSPTDELARTEQAIAEWMSRQQGATA
ncbi:cupin domain-containing protein [Streptomyces griseosporeus]|uniref:cupin domain-containing protein n=1 Tax=Streptomyces griseosporeus TaxID=1910 RepID=UPI0036F8211A